MLEMYTSLAITTLLFYIAYKGNQPKRKDTTTPRDNQGRYIRRTIKHTPRVIPVTINGKSEGSITL